MKYNLVYANIALILRNYILPIDISLTFAARK